MPPRPRLLNSETNVDPWTDTAPGISLIMDKKRSMIKPKNGNNICSGFFLTSSTEYSDNNRGKVRYLKNVSIIFLKLTLFTFKMSWRNRTVTVLVEGLSQDFVDERYAD